jgi:hypothetical protein
MDAHESDGGDQSHSSHPSHLVHEDMYEDDMMDMAGGIDSELSSADVVYMSDAGCRIVHAQYRGREVAVKYVKGEMRDR